MKTKIHFSSLTVGFFGGVLLIFGPGIFEIMGGIPEIALGFTKSISVSKNLEPWFLAVAYLLLSLPLLVVYLPLQRLFRKYNGSQPNVPLLRTTASFFTGVLAAYVVYYALFLYAVSRFRWF